MYERVKQLGGIFEIRSKPKHGTTVSVELPASAHAQFGADISGEGFARNVAAEPKRTTAVG